MKIIDLLNKIANGEEVPKKIREIGSRCIYYYDETDENEVARYKSYLGYWLVDENDLNDEVEIIEEDKKIEKIKVEIENERTGNCYIKNEYGKNCYLTRHSKIIIDKLNEIIDHINKEND